MRSNYSRKGISNELMGPKSRGRVCAVCASAVSAHQYGNCALPSESVTLCGQRVSERGAYVMTIDH
jgi:hypothetical protein